MSSCTTFMASVVRAYGALGFSALPGLAPPFIPRRGAVQCSTSSSRSCYAIIYLWGTRPFAAILWGQQRFAVGLVPHTFASAALTGRMTSRRFRPPVAG